MAHFVFLCVGAETELVDQVNHFAQIIAALQFVFDFRENFANLVFNGVGALGFEFELFEVGKSLLFTNR
jgi:hypothetical protein